MNFAKGSKNVMEYRQKENSNMPEFRIFSTNVMQKNIFAKNVKFPRNDFPISLETPSHA